MNDVETVCWGALAADAAAMGFHWMYESVWGEDAERLAGELDGETHETGGD